MKIEYTDTFALSTLGTSTFIETCFIAWREVYPSATKYMGHDVPYNGYALLWHVHLRPDILTSSEYARGLADHWDKTLRKTSNTVLTFAKNDNNYLLLYVSDVTEPHVLPPLTLKLFQCQAEDWVKTGNYPGKNYNITSGNAVQNYNIPVITKKKRSYNK